MSTLDKLLSSTSSHWPTLTPKARAELAALRADLQVAQQRIVALEAAVNEAQYFAQYVCDNEPSAEDIYIRASVWLAAHPAGTAAPQAEQFERNNQEGMNERSA